MKYHFISGLPRSGSTLLASILSQNPRFHASIMTPLGQIVTDAVTAMGPKNEASGFLGFDQRKNMLRGLFDGYYGGLEGSKSVVFDNNRRWCANAALTRDLYPDSLMLCCVRNPQNIVDSFERLFQQNPTTMSVIYGGVANTTVYDRCGELMKPQGVVGFALNAFRTAFFGPDNKRMMVINYDDLARFPAAVLTDLYNVLGEESYNHNFQQIDPIAGAFQFDQDVSTPGLHDLKSSVVYEPRQSVLPPDIFNALPKPFWQVNEVETSAR